MTGRRQDRSLFCGVKLMFDLFISTVAQGLMWSMLAIAVIAILGIPVSSIVALFASASVAIGLALQGALSNFAGGVMILAFKPFKVGDKIK